MGKLLGLPLAVFACLAAACAAQAQLPPLTQGSSDAAVVAKDSAARGGEAQTYGYAALAESLARQPLSTLPSLAKKLKQKDVCGNQTTAADQLCAIALYLSHDEKGRPLASVAPVLALVINEMSTDSPALLSQNKFAAARYAYTLDPHTGSLGRHPFSFIFEPRLLDLKTQDGKTAALKYEFITVIGREENRTRHYGIPPSAFELRTYTSF
jgi:hypothetical protein